MPTPTRIGGLNRWAWRVRRKAWQAQLPYPCARCGMPVLPTDAWDLDHVIPRRLGHGVGEVRPAHRTCNRRHGGQLSHQTRALPAPSRAW